MQSSTRINIDSLIDGMLEYVTTHLRLDGLQEETVTPYSRTFLGIGESKEGDKRSLALEVITDETLRDGKKPVKVFESLIRERSSPRRLASRRYTAFLFPRSVESSGVLTNFCRQYHLPDEVMANEQLMEMYADFNRNSVKELGRVEREVALKVCGSRIAYYNSVNRLIEIFNFQSFPSGQPIPTDRPPNQRYFWAPIETGHFPNGFHGGAQAFRGIEEGAHNRIKRIIQTQRIVGDFTLVDYVRPGRIAATKFEGVEDPYLFKIN